MKLGKKPYVPSHRDLKYGSYRSTNKNLPTLPSSFGHQNLVNDWGMLGNDQYGDCVFAGAAHETMLFTKEGSTEVEFTPQGVLSDYSAVTGFNPNVPSTDQGTNVRDALQYRQATGVIDGNNKRHKIGAFLSLDVTNLDEVLEATYLFSAVGIGIQFPASAMDQFDAGQPWTVVQGSKVNGGHYVPIVGADPSFIYCVTWGKVQPMTREFFNMYCDEAWLILSPEFLNGQGLSPEGFNLGQLQADLTAIQNMPVTYSFTLSTSSNQANIGDQISIYVNTLGNNHPMQNQNVTIKLQLTNGTYLPDIKVSTDAYGQSIVSIPSGISTAQTIKYYAVWDVGNGEQLISNAIDISWVIPVPKKLWHVETIPNNKLDQVQAQIDKLKSLGFDVYTTFSNQVVANSTQELAQVNSDKLTKAGFDNIILYY